MSFVRADALPARLEQSRFDNSRDAVLTELCVVDLLIIDDFALEPMGREEPRDVHTRVVERNADMHRRQPSTRTASRRDDNRRTDTSTLIVKSTPVPLSSALPVTNKRPTSREMDLPWKRPGLCSTDTAQKFLLRAQYLGTFVPVVTPDDTLLYVEPSVPTDAVAAIRDSVQGVRLRIDRALGLESAAPTIFVYPSVEALRKYACVNSSAVAYFDGAIHLAAVPSYGRYFEPVRSLAHEYVHHVLIGNGITRPIWLQEGAAMNIADERNWGERPRSWKDHPLSMEQMVRAFPNTASKEFAQAYYGQAFAMVEFLDRLCRAEENCNLETLVDALKNGQATPDTLFDWAVSKRGSDLVRTSALPLWDDYVIHQDFALATNLALLRRVAH